MKTKPIIRFEGKLAELTFTESPHKDIVVMVNLETRRMKASLLTDNSTTNLLLMSREIRIVNEWVDKQLGKGKRLKLLLNRLQKINTFINEELRDVSEYLDAEDDQDVTWEIENNIKLNYDLEKLKRIIKKQYNEESL